MYALMGNVVLTTPARWSRHGLRPFISGGVGLLHASQMNVANLPVNSNLFGFNVGGGAVGFITNRTGLRFDLRYFSNLRRDDEGLAFGRVRLSYWNAGVGVVLGTEVYPRGFAPRTPPHALSRAASPARSVRVARSRRSLASLERAPGL